MSNSTPQKTPLAATHEQIGGRMVDFAGWWMPVQYSGIIDEHNAVRNQAGLFDISHMGEFWIEGPNVTEVLNTILANDLAKIVDGQGQYTFLLNEKGGVIDDLIIYRISATQYFVVVNASMIEIDASWIQKHLPAGIKFENASNRYGGLALQGPLSEKILKLLVPTIEAPKRSRILQTTWKNHPLIVARTGYTGEDGFELFIAAEVAAELFLHLLEIGKPEGLKPAGLGARDTLRLESCYPLNGNDLSPDRTPLEADLGKFVSTTKAADYPGKSVLLAQSQKGIPSSLIAFKPIGKSAPPRAHYSIYSGDRKIGEVTSGSQSPTLSTGIGMGYVDSDF
ncbi:MAG: glycine cleavage system aminomethyltransferase GcvT, partial [Verrucomicrobiota bacterium]